MDKYKFNEAQRAEVEDVLVQMEDDPYELACELVFLRHELRRLQELQSSVLKIIYNSQGVAGWHLNGDVAGWEEVLPEFFE